MNRIPLLAVVAISAFVLSAVADAQSVKKWVDEDGVTHYSDQAPDKAASAVKNVDMEAASTTEYDSFETNQRIQNNLQKLVNERKQREAEAVDRRERRAAEEVLARDKLVEVPKKKKKKRKKKRRKVTKRSTRIINSQK